jgi:hypothetical protein
MFVEPTWSWSVTRTGKVTRPSTIPVGYVTRTWMWCPTTEGISKLSMAHQA